ncbi:MAG: response regulator [Hyphomicrobiales bacterium]
MDDNNQKNQVLTALLVEDSAMIAMDIEDILHEHGIDNVRLATTLEEADHHLTDTIDVAVLDFSLGEETTELLAIRMKDLGIPFIFVSGFAEKVGLDETLKGVPIVTKPFQPEDLMAAVNAALFRSPHNQNGTFPEHER